MFLRRPLAQLTEELQHERDREKLAQPELYLADPLDKLLIMHGGHRTLQLFPVLRDLMDRAWRGVRYAVQCMLLGSAWPNGKRSANEIKRGLSPKVERGFHAGCSDLSPARKLVVYSATNRSPWVMTSSPSRGQRCARNWRSHPIHDQAAT